MPSGPYWFWCTVIPEGKSFVVLQSAVFVGVCRIVFLKASSHCVSFWVAVNIETPPLLVWLTFADNPPMPSVGLPWVWVIDWLLAVFASATSVFSWSNTALFAPVAWLPTL